METDGIRMRIRVKICGITRQADADAAIEAGADALGFVLWNGSSRRVTVADVMRMSLALPPYVARVGVFVDELRPVLLAAVRNGRLIAAQLHGHEDPEFAGSLDMDWYRAFKVATGDEPDRVVQEITRFGDRPFMLDTRSSSVTGGTGRSFDRDLAAEIGRRIAVVSPEGRARMILAGGLTPDNVALTVRALRGNGLWAVDVSSGVESSPGIKDPGRIRRFIDEVRNAE